MYSQLFRYFRITAKCVSLPFVLSGVFLFIFHFLPDYAGKGVSFWVFFGGGMFWALDTLWVTMKGVTEIGKEIKEHRTKT